MRPLRFAPATLWLVLAASATLASTARAQNLDGRWKQGPLNETFAVQQWLPGCGPAPVSGTTGGGEIVTVSEEGDELSISGGGRVFRSNQCYDQLPTLAREAHSRDASGRSWRTRCATPPADPRRAVINTLVALTSDVRLSISETGRYEILLSDGRCVADVKRSRTLERIVETAPAASASASVSPPPQPPPAASTGRAPERPERGGACDSVGAPARVEVRPSRKLLRTGESFSFRAVVLDAKGCVASAPLTWTLDGPPLVSVDTHGKVSVPAEGSEGSTGLNVAVPGNAGLSARVTVDVTSPARYDELLTTSGLNASGEVDTPAVAGIETQSIGTADAKAEGNAGRRKTIFVSVIVGLASLLGVAALVAGRRARKLRQIEQAAESRRAAEHREATERAAAKRQAYDVQMRAHEESLERLKSYEAAKAARAKARDAAAPAAAPPVAAGMICPVCRRDYPPGGSFCPQDAARLVPHGQEAGRGPAGAICPVCRRGFEPGVRVCPEHREELVPYAMHAATQAAVAPAPRGKICPTCGGRFEGTASFCGKDGTALVLLN